MTTTNNRPRTVYASVYWGCERARKIRERGDEREAYEQINDKPMPVCKWKHKEGMSAGERGQFGVWVIET